MTISRRAFLLAALSLTATAAYGQTWRRMCVSTANNPNQCAGGAAVDWKQICTSDGNCAGRGYFAGGVYNGYLTGGILTNEIDGLRFSDVTAINPAATLIVSRATICSGNSVSRGYFAGGNTSMTGNVFTAMIDAIRFNDESVYNTGASMPGLLRSNAGSVNSGLMGYFGGGTTTAGGITNEIDSINYGTESTNNTVAGLTVARSALDGCSSSTMGYFCGGGNALPTNIIDAIQFAGETTVGTAASLAVARFNLASINSTSHGYLAGGSFVFSVTAEIDGINFATSTSINPAAALSPARGFASGVNSNKSGFFSGGVASGGTLLSQISGGVASGGTLLSQINNFQFSTESISIAASTLSVARWSMGSVQSGGFL